MEIVGQEDKRQIFALLTCSMSGKIPPPQRLYQGKTQHCTPTSVRFPKGWHVHYSKNHWSNEITMWRFVDTILLPYINKMLDSFDLPSKQLVLCVINIFAAHRKESFPKKRERKKNGIIAKFIPGGCTGELQPLDLSGNSQFKDLLKKPICDLVWYRNEKKM